MSRDASIAGSAAFESRETRLNSQVGRDESDSEMSMNALSARDALAAQARARAMFNRVLVGWASDVLRLERQRRLGRHWPGSSTCQDRAAA